MDKNSGHRTNVIGAGEVGVAVSVDMDKNSIHETNSLFWDTKGNDVLGATALPLYGAFVSEETCQLFGDVSGKKMLEIGCGSGQSLQYQGERRASELWGTDLSENQIEKTRQLLTAHGLSANLICSPMEEECGLPENYFDFVYSIYAIGWTTDLEGTFRRIASYLKKTAYLFLVGLTLYTNVLLQKMICLYLKNVISMNLGIRYLLRKVR
jgi:ubiquinone/menaquinone biosynthesis C-methylase UbiE